MGRDLPRGDVPALILAVLSIGPTHGYAIAREIELRSAGFLQLREGSLYPALRALEDQGAVSSAWETTGTGPARKVYTLTDEGCASLVERTNDWRTYAAAVAAVLDQRKVSFG